MNNSGILNTVARLILRQHEIRAPQKTEMENLENMAIFPNAMENEKLDRH